MSEEKKLPERVVLEVTRWREGNEPENPWTVAVQANPGEKWNPDIYASYYPESGLAAAREEGISAAAKEVDSWLDLLELYHRDILAKGQYKDPQEAGREYRNKCNLLGAVRASILKLGAAASRAGGGK